jgi:hypothetical protein
MYYIQTDSFPFYASCTTWSCTQQLYLHYFPSCLLLLCQLTALVTFCIVG